MQASDDRDAREARRRAEQETELRALADQAAEDALCEVERVRAETAETLARITAETGARVAEHQARAEQALAAGTDRTELERVRIDATEQVAAAQAAAEAHRQEVAAGRRRRR